MPFTLIATDIHNRLQLLGPRACTLEEMLNYIDMPVLDMIVQCCAMSPMAKHNGLAVCNRSLNVAWRRAHLYIMNNMLNESVKGITRGALRLSQATGPDVAEGRSEVHFYISVLDDLEDIM